MTLECSGNGSSKGFMNAVYNSRWTGTSLAPLLKKCRIDPKAKEIVFLGMDRKKETLRPGTNRELTVEVPFGRSMPVEEAMKLPLLLAYERNGEPLEKRNGAPLRLIVPGWYGVANVKWLTRINVRDRRYMGAAARRRRGGARAVPAGARPSRRRSVLAARSTRGAPARPRACAGRRRGRRPRRIRRLPRWLGGGGCRASVLVSARAERLAMRSGPLRRPLRDASAAPRARPQRLEQLAGRRLGGSELADHHRGGGVREHGRFRERRAGRERERGRGDHAVARAGHVEHLARRGGDMPGRLAALEQAHPELAARDEHGPAPECRQDAAPGRRELRRPREAQPRHLLGLEPGSASPPSRHDRSGSGAAWGPPAPARAACGRGAEGAGAAARRSPRPSRSRRRRALQPPAAPCARRRRAPARARAELARVLLVGPHDLLSVRDDAGLECRAPGRARVDQPRRHVARGERLAHAPARRVAAHEAARAAAPPRVRTLAATLPAPPRWKLWPVT